MPGVPLATHPRSSPSSFFSCAGLASPPFSHFVWARRHCLTRKEILQRGKKIKDASQNLIFGETLARSHTRGMRRLHERTPPPDSDSKASEFPLFDPETSFSGSPPLPASAQPSITGSKKRRRSRLTSHCQVRGYFFQDARKKEKKEGSDARHLQSRIRKKMIFFLSSLFGTFYVFEKYFFRTVLVQARTQYNCVAKYALENVFGFFTPSPLKGFSRIPRQTEGIQEFWGYNFDFTAIGAAMDQRGLAGPCVHGSRN